ncbi:amidohydrolase family protein [Phenylobacterium sp.]|jgi:predicted TIM-barrel fold metal-dependent hydrolase|uniref:amidohydrolase family protein n=1 Tax=Phenylobacterium sp. TaxID=1871053 RepID=UPI002F41DC7B
MTTLVSAKPASKPNPFAGLKVIDVDTHWTEPVDLWTSRATGAMKELVPQVREKDGEAWWFIDGKPFGKSQHSSCIMKDGAKLHGMGFWDLKFDEVHEGSHDVKARLKVMDDMGVYAQIVYPNVLGFGNTKASAFAPETRMAATTIYNDAAAEMQAASGGRMFPMALTPWWDIKAAVKEIRRCHAMGMRGINTNSDPQDAGMPDLNERFWDPLWEVCTELDLPINFHIGSSQTQNSWFGGTPWPSHGKDQKLAIGGAMMFFSNARVLTNLIFSGVLERFPKLKFVSVESGIGWIPYLLDSLDYQCEELAPESMSYLTMKPSDYFRRNIYACFWFERKGMREMVDLVGVDNVMWETDYPHPVCLYPNSLDVTAKTLERFTSAETKKIMSANAAGVYNIAV